MDKEIKIESVTIGEFADRDPVQGAAIDHSVKTGAPLFRVTKQIVIANKGGFEPHPESYTPRVFAAVWERGAKVYEILQNGQAIPWPRLPTEFDYWALHVEHLSDVYMHRAPKKAGFGPSTQKAIDDAQIAHRQYQQDPVSQADGYSENYPTLPVVPPEVWDALKESEERAERESGTLPENVTWIGEIDGKKYTGLNRTKHGPCPECYAQFRPDSTGDTLGDYIHAAGCLLAQSEATAGKIEESGNPTDLPEGSH